MTAAHMALMRALLNGKSVKEAAKEAGMSTKWAYIVRKSPLFVEEMERIKQRMTQEFIENKIARENRDPTRRTLLDSTLKAAEALNKALEAKDLQAVIRAAATILDRTGYVKEEKIKKEVLVEPSQGLLNALARASRGEIIDAETVGDDPEPAAE